MEIKEIEKDLSHFGQDLVKEILGSCVIKEFPKKQN